MPVTLPEASTVANDVAVLLHVPPVAPSVSDVLLAAHTVDAPDMVPASGNGLTVNVCVAAAVPQLLATAYDIVVVPATRPFTLPEASTVANAGAVLLQVPPLVPVTSVSEVVKPEHTDGVPVIAPAFGAGFTVSTTESYSVPQLLVNV